jgi:putative heme-binding domain-containing protein
MRGQGLLVAVVLLVSFSLAGGLRSQPPKDKYSEHIAPTGPRTPQEQQKLFRLPPGFEIQLVAWEPDIKMPINIAFDAKGRLWVTMSQEYPFPYFGRRPKRDTVKILENFGPDGRARQITTFADNLNIPIGVLPLGAGDNALVYSIPGIWRMSDTAGSGKADKRELLYGKYGFADTHGMTGEFQMGFDGWVYACHGYSNTSTVTAKDGSAITMTSGNTYRIKPDGSRIEYWTHGQVNPFGLSFDPLGNLFSCDCHSRPVMQLLRGGWYTSFARGNDGLGFAPEMMTHDHGSTAIAGITYYAANHFPQEFRDNVFIGNVVTNRINRDKLQRHGSTYLAIEMPDFVKCDDPWFRPVDIRLGPDGALYIADFYTKIIGHYEVPLNHPLRDNNHGRIWRIVYTGKDGVPLGKLVDYTKAKVDELVQLLDVPNLTVRLTATHQLAERGGKDVIGEMRKLLDSTGTRWQRVHALWVLERLGQLDDKRLAASASDPVVAIRVHAMRVLADRKDFGNEHRKLVLAALKDSDAFVQRCAAEALATHPHPDNLAALLELRHAVPKADTHLLYAVRVALRDQLHSDAVWLSLKGAELQERDAKALADVCLGVPGQRSAQFLLQHLQQLKKDTEHPALEARFAHHVARHGTDAAVAELAVFIHSGRSARLAVQVELFKAMQKGLQESNRPLSKYALQLGSELTGSLLNSSSVQAFQMGIEMVGTLRLTKFEPMLLDVLAKKAGVVDLRRAAATALTAIDPKKHIDALAAVLADAAEPPALREQFATTLAATNQAEAHAALVKVLATAPAKLETTIATSLAGSKQGAEKLLDAIAAGKASPRLLLDPSIANKLKQTNLPDLGARIAKLTMGLPTADAQLLKLIQNRKTAFVKGKGDVARGAAVFEKHCANCHIIANKGSKIGPQLDGIGIRGLDRLLEDILDPNRNIDQAFRTTSLTLKDGKIVSGLFLREDGAIWVLADQQGKEVRVGAGTVDQKQVIQLSPMPANFGDIAVPEFVDLLAYLLEQRPRTP